MSNSQVIDYVMHSPYNTNPNVLKTMLEDNSNDGPWSVLYRDNFTFEILETGNAGVYPNKTRTDGALIARLNMPSLPLENLYSLVVKTDAGKAFHASTYLTEWDGKYGYPGANNSVEISGIYLYIYTNAILVYNNGSSLEENTSTFQSWVNQLKTCELIVGYFDVNKIQ